MTPPGNAWGCNPPDVSFDVSFDSFDGALPGIPGGCPVAAPSDRVHACAAVWCSTASPRGGSGAR
eukprot:6692982-Alexandrium_andersonii.AAC.1